MNFIKFYKQVEVGDSVKVTDTFLVAHPFWTGRCTSKSSTGDVTITWDDGAKPTVYNSSVARSTDEFIITEQ